jgi:hypothetical protein
MRGLLQGLLLLRALLAHTGVADGARGTAFYAPRAHLFPASVTNVRSVSFARRPLLQGRHVLCAHNSTASQESFAWENSTASQPTFASSKRLIDLLLSRRRFIKNMAVWFAVSWVFARIAPPKKSPLGNSGRDSKVLETTAEVKAAAGEAVQNSAQVSDEHTHFSAFSTSKNFLSHGIAGRIDRGCI